MTINNPAVVTELTRLHTIYEKALVENDVETLDSLFWDSEMAVRYGASENLYGISEVRAFRQARSKLNLAREIERLEIVAFGDSAGAINLQFIRPINGVKRRGRQSQFWIRFGEGWKIASAHVSFPSSAASYVEQLSERLPLPIAETDRAAVEMEFERIASVAQTLLRFPLEESLETAPVFRP